jgi:16S rRNA (adenine1518-N6/adenine1519-N6)-dimethyltransferase
VARQRLGQHFLAGAGWRERLARAVLSPRDADGGGVWIEIGAGHGEMTALLARQASRVIAIELDAKLLPGLRALAAELGNVSVVSGDVLEMDFGELAGGWRYRVYGNIPYYISSPIVHHLFARPEGLQAAFLVVQREVAERLTARPGRREYGYLSAFAQFHARAEILMRIPPGAFRPPPKVDSALVALRLPGERAALPVGDEAAFVKFLKVCFAQKRKTLRNNLRPVAPGGRAEQLLAERGIAPGARAEELSVRELAGLFGALRQGVRDESRSSAARRSG